MGKSKIQSIVVFCAGAEGAMQRAQKEEDQSNIFSGFWQLPIASLASSRMANYLGGLFLPFLGWEKARA